MKRFNKYHFISDLKEAMGEFLEDSDFEDDENIDDDMQQFIHEYIDNEVIYYHDCWQICMQEGNTDFNIEQIGEKAKSITELAYWTLTTIVDENINCYLEAKELKEELEKTETL
jgi:regulator of replication initiation timing|tara:strand:- start:610 stop:951 length:342 start_codon:yes stop_codon:yes gene_type:complete